MFVNPFMIFLLSVHFLPNHPVWITLGQVGIVRAVTIGCSIFTEFVDSCADDRLGCQT